MLGYNDLGSGGLEQAEWEHLTSEGGVYGSGG